MARMEIISAHDLDEWASSYQAKADLPWLIQRLIRATCPQIGRLDMPGGEEVYLSGFDGVLECTGGNRFIPDGRSAWELSTEKDVSGKATEDYEKRTQQVDSGSKHVTTFVFATPKRWPYRDKWQEKKRAAGDWRDVRCLRSDDLASWLDDAPCWVAFSFAHSAFGRSPDHYTPLDIMWEEYASVPSLHGKLSEDLVLAGRKDAADALASWLQDDSRLDRKIIRLIGSSEREILDFIVATVHSRGEALWREFVSCMCVIEGRSAALCLGGLRSHHVVIPLGNAVPHITGLCHLGQCRAILTRAMPAGGTIPSVPGVNDIALPRLLEADAIRALIKAGYDREKAAVICGKDRTYDAIKQDLSSW